MKDEYPDLSAYKSDSRTKSPYGSIRAEIGMMFKAFYDIALDSGMTAEPFFDVSKVNYQLSTLQNRMSESLRYLTLVEIQGSKYTRADYIKLKTRCKLFKFEFNGRQGIVLRYTKIGAITDASIEIINTITDNGLPLWRVKLNEFLDDPKMTYLELSTTTMLGSSLSADDRAYIARTFDSAELTWEFVGEGFKVLRV